MSEMRFRGHKRSGSNGGSYSSDPGEDNPELHPSLMGTDIPHQHDRSPTVTVVHRATDTEVDYHTTEDPKEFLRDALRPWLLEMVEYSAVNQVPQFQRMFGVSSPDSADIIKEAWYNPNTPILKRLFYMVFALMFKLGNMLGHESFIILFNPFVFWNVDIELGVRIIVIWVTAMYFGQSLKDHFKLPRPMLIAPNKVTVLDTAHVAEYGFPSTHTSSILCQACLIVYHTWLKDYNGAGQYPLTFAIALAFVVVLMTALGRLYSGMHTVPDLIGGVVVGLLTVWFVLYIDEYLMLWILESPGVLYIPTIVCILFLALYPRARRWNTSYEDTAMVAGVGNGVVSGAHLWLKRGKSAIPLPWMNVDFKLWLLLALARAILGYVIILSTRLFAKRIGQTVMEAILPHTIHRSSRKYAKNVPVKFFTYGTIAFVASLAVPMTFEAVGLTINLIL